MCFCCCVYTSSCIWQCPLLGAENKFSSLLWVSEIKLRLGCKTPQPIILFCFETKSYHITLTCSWPWTCGPLPLLVLGLQVGTTMSRCCFMFMQLMKTLPPSPKGWDFRTVAVLQLSTLLSSALSFSWLTVQQDKVVGCIKTEYWPNQKRASQSISNSYIFTWQAWLRKTMS